MRPYKYYKFAEYPDVMDIQRDGRKSRVGRLEGDESTYGRNTERKKKIRRALKRRDKRKSEEDYADEEIF